MIYGIYRNDNGINILDYTKGYEVKKARMKNVYNRDLCSFTDGIRGNFGSNNRLIDKFFKKYNKNPEEVYVFSSLNGTRRLMFAFFDKDNKIKFVDLHEIRKRFEENNFNETEENKIFYTVEDMRKELPVDKGNNEIILYGDKSYKNKVKQSVDTVVAKKNSDYKNDNKKEKNSSSINTIIYASLGIIVISGIFFTIFKIKKDKKR